MSEIKLNEFSTNYLDLKVGYRCNNDCVHCVIRDYEAELLRTDKPTDCSTRECCAIIDEAARRGVGTLVLTGGEPTIRPDFFQLLTHAHAAGLRVAVQTNGRSFNAPGFCDRLKTCGKPKFVVALHGYDAPMHDAISRRRGSFDQTCRGIRNLCSAGYPVTGKLVISRLNAGGLVRTMELMASLGVCRGLFAFPHGHGSARIHYRAIVPRYSDLRPEIDRLTRSAAERGFDLRLEAFPLCVLDEPQYVSELHYLVPGRHLCIPSHAEEFDWDIMRLRDKQSFAQCAACACNAYCEGPWKEYPATFGDTEFQPLPPETLLTLLALAVTETQDGVPA